MFEFLEAWGKALNSLWSGIARYAPLYGNHFPPSVNPKSLVFVKINKGNRGSQFFKGQVRVKVAAIQGNMKAISVAN